MKLVKNIGGRIWAAWGLLVFIISMLVALMIMLPCIWLSDPQRASWQQKISKGWMRFFLLLTGCRLRVYNRHFYDKKTNYIVVCNHRSFMDVIATNPFLPNTSKTIAKKSFAKIPVFGWIYHWGSVLVDRSSDASRKQSYMDMKEVLNKGMDMVLFPEGTRNKTSKPLGSFQNGAFRLSVESRTPVIPVVLIGTEKMLPAQKPFFLWPGTIHLHYLPPIYPERHSASELKAKVYELMWNYYEANY